MPFILELKTFKLVLNLKTLKLIKKIMKTLIIQTFNLNWN